MSDGTLTKAMLDEAILSTYRAAPQPQMWLVSPKVTTLLDMLHEAHDAGWDRRRLEREVRRIGKASHRKPYHKKPRQGDDRPVITSTWVSTAVRGKQR